MARRGYSDIVAIRHKRQKNLKDGFGGKCVICGYNKCYRALLFHHVSQSEKDFTIGSSLLWRWDTIIGEAKKCILVCTNCHNEIHEGLYSKEVIQEYHRNTIPDFSILTPPKVSTKPELPRECGACKKIFQTKDYNQKYCCSKCAYLSKRRCIRPPHHILLKQLTESNFVQLGKRYGVSDNAIRKWLGLKR